DFSHEPPVGDNLFAGFFSNATLIVCIIASDISGQFGPAPPSRDHLAPPIGIVHRAASGQSLLEVGQSPGGRRSCGAAQRIEVSLVIVAGPEPRRRTKILLSLKKAITLLNA